MQWKMSFRLLWFMSGLAAGMTFVTVAMGAIPKDLSRRVTDDTVLYQSLHELNIKKEKVPNFDSDIQRLASVEKRFAEELPLDSRRKYRPAMKRIEKQPYRYSQIPQKRRRQSP